MDVDDEFSIDLNSDAGDVTTNHDEIQFDLDTPRETTLDLSNLLQIQDDLNIPSICVSEFDADLSEKHVDVCIDNDEASDINTELTVSQDEETESEFSNINQSNQIEDQDDIEIKADTVETIQNNTSSGENSSSTHIGSGDPEVIDDNIKLDTTENAEQKPEEMVAENELNKIEEEFNTKHSIEFTNLSDHEPQVSTSTCFEKTDEVVSNVSEAHEPQVSTSTCFEKTDEVVANVSEAHKPQVSSSTCFEKTDEVVSNVSEASGTDLDTRLKEIPSLASSIAVSGDVSLDNIEVTEKADNDSDDEFDFDLPTAPVALPKTPVAMPTDPASQKSPVVHSLENKNQTASGENTNTVSAVTAATGAIPKVMKTAPATPVVVPPTTPAVPAIQTNKPVGVIKPTTQTQNFTASVQPPVDPRSQRVLEAAQDEWEKVKTIQAGFKDTSADGRGTEPTVVETVKTMSPYELAQTFMQEDFSSVRASIKPAVERKGFAAFVNLLFGPPKLHRNLIEERDKVFCVAATQLSNENSSHIRTLQTIYRSLTGSKFDCARMGSHWEEIGFQGNDPATDLRGAGLLGLMNLLYILKDPKKQALASDIYKLSLHPSQNFPFCVMGINLSRITLQTLREDLLNKECNRRGEVISVVNDFYTGLYLQLYQVWKSQGKTISDSGYVIKDIELQAKKNTKDVFKHLNEYLNRKTTIVVDKVTDPGGDNFTNVCDD